MAVEVVRRGGAEYDCSDADAHRRCTTLFAGLKQAGLAAFEVADDLTQMPHSVLVKIQVGGLTGLRRVLDPAADADAPIADVAALVTQAEGTYGGLQQLPLAQFTDDMLGCKLERRTRRRGR
jgi:hypothetical protein